MFLFIFLFTENILNSAPNFLAVKVRSQQSKKYSKKKHLLKYISSVFVLHYFSTLKKTGFRIVLKNPRTRYLMNLNEEHLKSRGEFHFTESYFVPCVIRWA